jgi:hypothetical protein
MKWFKGGRLKSLEEGDGVEFDISQPKGQQCQISLLKKQSFALVSPRSIER